MSLVLALSGRELGLTAAQIFKLVPAYAEGNEEAQQKRFTRDKADLLDLGFNLETDRNYLGETVYRLRKGSGISADLTATEEFLVHAAAGLWSDELEPDFTLRLKAALTSPEIMPSSHLASLRAVAAFAKAVSLEQPVLFTYRRRDGDKQRRRVDPWYIFMQEGSLYLAGYDHLRRERRVFRLSRVDDADIEILPQQMLMPPPAQKSGLMLVTPLLVVREGAAPLTRQHTTRLANEAPAGWEVHDGNAASLGVWLERVLGEVEDVVVLGPPSLVEAVDSRLEALGE